MAENGVIGRCGALPWRLPADLKRFRELTIEHTVVMGRKTFESIGKPLTNRRNVVLSRDSTFRSEGVIVVHNLAEALCGNEGDAEVFVVGGAEVYRQTISTADRVYQTLVHSEVEGDASFTEFNAAKWHLQEDEFHEPDAAHAYALSFRTYIRSEKGPVS